MRLRPVPDARALRLELHEDDRGGPSVAVVVAELHLGLETTMSRSGAHVASSTDAIGSSLVELARSEGAGRIIVAGDLKQTVPALTWQERREVPRFLETVSRAVPLHIVLGNHDAELARLVPPMLREGGRVVLYGPEGIRLGGDEGRGGVGIFHGHAWPGADVVVADELVSAHTHPAVALVDGMGHAHVEPCWVRGPLREGVLVDRYGEPSPGRGFASRMTLLPPYNPLLGGAAVNVDGLLGPAGKLLDLDDAELYLLDGTSLGGLRNLPPVPADWRKRRRRVKGEAL